MLANMDTPGSWRTNLRAVWISQLVAVIGVTAIVPFLPLLVQQMGVEGERETRIWAGLVYSAHAATMAIFGPVWGALSDRYGRKIMVERAMLAGAILTTLMGFAQTVQELALLRALNGALAGIITPATTLVAASAPRKHAGYALGTLQTAVYLGAAVGPLLGGVIADHLDYRTPFWVSASLLFLAMWGIVFFVQEPPRTLDHPRHQRGSGDERRPGLLRRAKMHLSPIPRSGPLLAALLTRALTRLAFRFPMSTLPLLVQEIAPENVPVASLTGLVTGANAATVAVSSLGFGQLGDRIGHHRISVACALASAVLYAPQLFVSHPMSLLALQAASGVAMGGMMSSVSAALATLSADGREGIVYGMDATAISLANVVGPLLGSMLAAWTDLRAPFLAASAASAAAGICALRFFSISSPWQGPRPRS